MSPTLLVWLSTFAALCLKGLYRPLYACLAYLMTFYLPPPFWWWGRGFLSNIWTRWSLLGIAIVGISVLLNWSKTATLKKHDRWFIGALLFYVANAFLVNALLADSPQYSWNQLDMLWKACGLAFLLRLSLRSIDDLHFIFMFILLLSSFVGYSVIFNGAGSIENGRLEGLNFPGATGANGAATILILGFPIAGYFLIANPVPYARIMSLVSAPLILETVLRCNSRGAYLGAAVSGAALVYFARGQSRRYALFILMGGAIAFLILAQSENIWERLFSIAASEEERDGSASGRLEYWKAGLNMIADHPLGKGGGAAFHSPLGMQYITHIRTDEFRSIHNGYLNITAGWGVQGFVFYIAALLVGCHATWKKLKSLDPRLDEKQILLGSCILAALLGQATTTMFGDYLDGEWFIWLAVFGLVFAGLDAQPVTVSELDQLDHV